MTRYRVNANVLGYSPGDEFEAEGDEADAVSPYVLGGHVSVLAPGTGPEPEPAEDDGTGPGGNLGSASVAELRALAVSYGLPSGGKADALRVRISEHLALEGEGAADYEG